MNPTDFARDVNYVYPLEMGLQAIRACSLPEPNHHHSRGGGVSIKVGSPHSLCAGIHK
jgi:hypothetical protein